MKARCAELLSSILTPKLLPLQPRPEVCSSLSPPSAEEAAALTAKLPLLDGRPLEPPRFHTTNWRVYQVFSAKDDPDRTLDDWEPLSFLRLCDPILQRSRTSVEELPLPRGHRERGSFARVITGVLDEGHCAEVIARVNRKGFTPALINIGDGKQVLEPEARDGHRVIFDCPCMAAWLLEVLRPYLPDPFLPDGSSLLEVNERCRVLCYTPGQQFPGHWDGKFQKQTGQHSLVTIQLYLHDVPSGNGGATTFIFHDEGRIPCQPRAGSVLIFTQDLYHEGSLLRSGLKYTLRTEAMYLNKLRSQR